MYSHRAIPPFVLKDDSPGVFPVARCSPRGGCLYEQLRGKTRAFELHLCIEQVAEFVGDILAVTDDSCRLVDGREFREAVCRVVVADGINGNVHTCNDILCLRELITGIAITIRQDKDDWRAISAEFLRFFIDTVHCNTKTVIHSGIAVRVEGIYSTLVQIGIDSLNGATP